MKAVQKHIRISPKKLQVICDMVRSQKVRVALTQLKFIPKKGAHFVYKAVHSAAANAEKNHNLKSEDLSISEIFVTPAKTLKRGLFVGRGRWHAIRKRSSHLTVKLS